MAAYLIYRMKDQASQQFRWAPHVSGATQIKRKDYEQGASIDAGNEYAAWQALRDMGSPLRVGDLLESPSGELRICKYVGFDAAQWIAPEVKTGLESAPVAAGPAPGSCEAS
jgi:hypothetical protein